MRRTLLGQCRDCKYAMLFTSCYRENCKTCKMYTKPVPIGSDENGEIEEPHDIICMCLCDATDEEVKTGTCKYKEVR